jgi:hypothetical protein
MLLIQTLSLFTSSLSKNFNSQLLLTLHELGSSPEANSLWPPSSILPVGFALFRKSAHPFFPILGRVTAVR